MKKAYLILFTSLILIFSCESCMAKSLTIEDVKYIFKYALTTEPLSGENLNYTTKYSITSLENSYEESGTKTLHKANMYELFHNEDVMNNFLYQFNKANNALNNNLESSHYVFLFYSSNYFNREFSSNDKMNVLCMPINNTLGDELPHLCIYYNQYPESSYGIGQITVTFLSNDENNNTYEMTTEEKNKISYKPFILSINQTTKDVIYTASDYNSKKFHIVVETSKRQLICTYKSGTSVVYTPYNIVYPYNLAINTLYAPTDKTKAYNSYNSSTFEPYIVKSFGAGNAGDSGTTGGDTGDSGTTGGTTTTDLSKVETGIDNINQN